MKRQWHPAFVQLLRPSVGEHYEVKTSVPVGDAPRLADIVLLRRTSEGSLPFRGLWQHLTTWNVLEFKGPTVSPRAEHLDLLVELGLGIDRRLNEERERAGRAPLAPTEVSFWYVANHIGRRFLAGCREAAGELEDLGPGVWRCTVLRRPVFLVSGIDLPVEPDSLPMHLIGRESQEREREVGEFLLRHPALWREYGGFLAALHPKVWKEVEAMAKTRQRGFVFDLEPLVQTVGLKKLLDVFGDERVVEQLGAARVAKLLGQEKFLSQLSAEERRQLIERLGGVAPPPK
jgi:hypothetical protein